MHLKQLFELSTLGYREGEVVSGFPQRLARWQLLLQPILDIVEQLQLTHHLQQSLFVNILNVETVSLDVLYYFFVDLWLVEVG